MKRVPPVSDLSCTIPGRAPRRDATTGMTILPSRIVGGASLETPAAVILSEILAASLDRDSLMEAEVRASFERRVEASGATVPDGVVILMRCLVSWGRTGRSSRSCASAPSLHSIPVRSRPSLKAESESRASARARITPGSTAIEPASIGRRASKRGSTDPPGIPEPAASSAAASSVSSASLTDVLRSEAGSRADTRSAPPALPASVRTTSSTRSNSSLA